MPVNLFSQWPKNGCMLYDVTGALKCGMAELAKFHIYRCRNAGLQSVSTVKPSKFGHKVVPEGQITCTIFKKFFMFIHVYSEPV